MPNVIARNTDSGCYWWARFSYDDIKVVYSPVQLFTSTIFDPNNWTTILQSSDVDMSFVQLCISNCSITIVDRKCKYVCVCVHVFVRRVYIEQLLSNWLKLRVDLLIGKWAKNVPISKESEFVDLLMWN